MVELTLSSNLLVMVPLKSASLLIDAANLLSVLRLSGGEPKIAEMLLSTSSLP